MSRSIVFIRLACHHHFPGDPGDLVGQRHGHEFRRFALEQLDEPGRGIPAFACSHLSKQRSRAHDQCLAQGLVASSRITPVPDLAGCRVISGRQAHPGGKLPSRYKLLRCRRFHYQQDRTDWPDTRDRCEAATTFVAAIPSQQFRLYLFQAFLQLRKFIRQ